MPNAATRAAWIIGGSIVGASIVVATLIVVAVLNVLAAQVTRWLFIMVAGATVTFEFRP